MTPPSSEGYFLLQLSGGVTVAQGPLEAFVMVRIHAGQPLFLTKIPHENAGEDKTRKCFAKNPNPEPANEKTVKFPEVEHLLPASQVKPAVKKFLSVLILCPKILSHRKY